MSLQSLSASFQTSRLPIFDGGGAKPIDIQVSDGDFQSYDDLRRKVVMQALATTDAARADEFIRQSGFDFGRDLPPRLRENGKTFYRFEPSPDFLKSITSFQQTGTALKLRETETPTEKSPLNPADNSPKQTNLPQYPNYSPKPLQKLAAKNVNVPQTVAATKKRVAAESNWVKVKLDPHHFATVSKGKDGKLNVQIKAADGDPRQEISETAFRAYFQGKYSSQTLDLYLAQHPKTDGNSVFHWNKDANGADVPASLKETKEKLGAAIVGGRPYEFGIDKSVGDALARLQIENFGSDQAKLDLKIKDRLKEIDDEFNKIPIQNDLQKAAVEWKREIAKKDAIDEMVSGSNIDFRKPDETGSGLADSFEKAVRTMVDSHPFYKFLPESAKQQLVNFGVGIGKGTVNLIGSAAGIGNFVRDAAQDLVLSGAEKAGVDVTNARKNFETSRRDEQQIWSNVMNFRTQEMARGDYAYNTKIDKKLNVTVYDTPNWASNMGNLTAQAIPFMIVGAATGGMSVPVQMGVMAATSGGKELGATYAQTGNRADSLKSAAWGAAQGAVIPLTAKLPFPADVVSNAATGYVFAKVRDPHADDNQIVQSIILQTAQGGAFKLGSELHQTLSQKVGHNLNETELKQTYEQEIKNDLEVIKDEVAKSAAEQGKRVIEDLQRQSKTTTTGNAKVTESKIQGNSKRAELETKLKKAQEANNSLKTQIFGKISEGYSKISESVSLQVENKKIVQDTKNIDKLYDSANTASKELEMMTDEFAKETGGEAGLRPKEINGGLKSKERALEKIASDYNGDASMLVDIAGSKVTYESLDSLYSALEKFSNKYEIVRFKDRILNPTPSGYRDILMNVKMKNGHIVEFRLHLKDMDDASSLSHKVYQEQRSIEALGKIRNLTNEEKARIKFLKNQQIKIHNDAWNRILEKENR